MGERRSGQEALFYEFSLKRHVPADHSLRSIDRFVDLGEVRCELAHFYSEVGRPSIDPELMIRMLIVGYCFGIRSERRLCEEVHLNLAYRWFCRLGFDGVVPDHSTFRRTGTAVSATAAALARPKHLSAHNGCKWRAKPPRPGPAQRVSWWGCDQVAILLMVCSCVG